MMYTTKNISQLGGSLMKAMYINAVSYTHLDVYKRQAFAHKIQAPVADSLMGKGAFDGADELYTGMVGMHGTKTSNFGITEADLLIVVGARFSDRVTGNASKFAKNAKILQLDIDPAEINKNIKVDASIIGDCLLYTSRCV